MVSLSCFSISAGSLCKRKTPECDKETSICTDLDGVALCQCKSGYFQFNKMDHSCRGTPGSPGWCGPSWDREDDFLCQGLSFCSRCDCSKLGVTSSCYTARLSTLSPWNNSIISDQCALASPLHSKGKKREWNACGSNAFSSFLFFFFSTLRKLAKLPFQFPKFYSIVC